MRLFVAGLAATAALCVTADAGAQTPSRALTAFEVTRTQRLIEHRLACLGCHRIDGRGGQIGPSLDGLGDRADADDVRRMILDPAGTLPGTTMPPQALRNVDLDRLVAYLLALPAEPASAEPLVVPEAPPPIPDSLLYDGAALYARHCAGCHGAGGRGDGWNAPNLPIVPTAHADAKLMRERPDDTLFDAIFAGAFVLDGSGRMPPFGRLLAPTQIRALVAHIRKLCDCAQPAWAGSR
jgi:mono/diheme cytochrome c family protein